MTAAQPTNQKLKQNAKTQDFDCMQTLSVLYKKQLAAIYQQQCFS